MPISLASWDSFYVITGSSGAALTGLMFVVIALAADRRQHTPSDALTAFSTPTVAHFSIVLLLASVMTMPLRNVLSLSILLCLCAAFGLVSITRAGLRMGRLTVYDPETEDWLFNVILPFLAYLCLLACALLLGRYPGPTMFGIAIVVLTLLFIGIRNAWDVAVFLVTKPPGATAEPHTARPQAPSNKKKHR